MSRSFWTKSGLVSGTANGQTGLHECSLPSSRLSIPLIFFYREKIPREPCLSGPTRITIEIIVNGPLRVYREVYQHEPLAIYEPQRIRLMCCILMPLVIKYLLLSIAFVSYFISNGRTVWRTKIATVNNDPNKSKRSIANLGNFTNFIVLSLPFFQYVFYMIFIFINTCTIIFNSLQ